MSTVAPPVYVRENALLLATARAAPPTEAQRDLLPALDWDYLLAAADRQGATPLLHRWVQAHGLAVPSAPLTTLQTVYWTNHFRNATLLRELARVREAASAVGVPLLPLKGAALAPTYYPSPALRPMSDLDLLARVADFDRVGEVFATLGYAETPRTAAFVAERLRQPWQRERQFTATRAGMTVLVEVRAEPLDPAPSPVAELDTALAARLAAYAANVWARATAHDDDTAHITPEDLCLHVASHMVTRHADYRLIWLLDLAHLLRGTPDFDWHYLARESRALGLTVPVETALDAAARWLDAPAPPAGIWNDRATVPSVARFVATMERRVLTERINSLPDTDLAMPPLAPFWTVAASLARMRGVSPRLRVLRWLLFPSGGYLALQRGEEADIRGWRYARVAAARIGTAATTGISAVARPVMHRIMMRRLPRIGRSLRNPV